MLFDILLCQNNFIVSINAQMLIAQTTMATTHHYTVRSLFALVLSQHTIFSENIANSKPQNVRLAISTIALLNVVQVTSPPNLIGSIGVAGSHIQNATENNKTRNQMT